MKYDLFFQVRIEKVNEFVVTGNKKQFCGPGYKCGRAGHLWPAGRLSDQAALSYILTVAKEEEKI